MGKRYQNPIYELIKRYQPDFEEYIDSLVVNTDLELDDNDLFNRF